MKFQGLLCALILSLGLLVTSEVSGFQRETDVDDRIDIPEESWPWWRGPGRMGEAIVDDLLPTTWSDERNVRWKTAIPGRGHGSPIVLTGCIYLPTADEESGRQSVLCLDRASGELLWNTTVHAAGAMQKNEKSTASSSTLATDGELIFANFPNSGGVTTTALSISGEIVWQTRICDYTIHQGYGSSPALYRDLVIVSADNKAGGVISALNRNTGDPVWTHQRPQMPNYPSPTLLRIGGVDQLLMIGCERVTSLNPLTGETYWESEGATTECVTSTVTDGTHIYSSGGYPRNHLSAFSANLSDGTHGELVWETNDRIYVPSMLIRDGFLYAVQDAGIAVCFDAATGESRWKARLGGEFTASPVLVGDHIYAIDESGITTIFEANPDRFVKIATNELADEAFATPTICGKQIFFRVAEHRGEQRQEFLICIEKQTDD